MLVDLLQQLLKGGNEHWKFIFCTVVIKRKRIIFLIDVTNFLTTDASTVDGKFFAKD
jgi:hypothetical protein